MRELLKIKNLSIKFKGEMEYYIINNIDFEIKKGERIGLVGESGCGKTTVALSIMGLLPESIEISEGEISLYTEEGVTLLNNLSSTSSEWRNIRGKVISMIFQEPSSSLNPTMNIGYQIMEPLLYRSYSRKEAKRKAIEMMEKVGLPSPEEIFKRFPHELSGGMQQRVMIAISLILNPSLLIADEPTTSLDVTIQAGILKLIEDLNKEMKMAVLLITHDLGVVSEVVENMMVMYSGEIVEKGKVENLLNNPLHPYMKGLIASFPEIHKSKEKLKSMKGNVPPPWKRAEGCLFAPRCPYRMDICSKKPKWKEKEKGHYVRCWLYE